MWLNKKRRKDLFLVSFRTLCLIVGSNICLTSLFTIIKLDLNKDNFEPEMNLNINKLKSTQNVQFVLDIY